LSLFYFFVCLVFNQEIDVMGRKKAVVEDARPAVKTGPDSFFQQVLNMRQVENGPGNDYLCDDSTKVIIGAPLDAISLRYLFCNSVFPYSRMTEIIGIPESCKTALLYEMYRWHIYNGSKIVKFDPGMPHGLFGHIQVEAKDSPDFRESFIKAPLPFKSHSCLTVESWQKMCSEYVKAAEAHYDCRGGMEMPMALGVDSITAATTKSETDDTWKNGYATPTFSNIAKNLNMWVKVFFPKMQYWPISFIGINHMKEEHSPGKPIIRRVPGGASLGFTSTFILRMARKADIHTKSEQGRLIRIHSDKNSLSSAGDRRYIEVKLLWTKDENLVQTSMWDWHDATVALFDSFQEAWQRKAVHNACSIENIDKTRRTADCPVLGISKGSWHEVGKAISESPELVKELDKVFGVCPRRPFEMGVPYKDQIQEALSTNPETGEISMPGGFSNVVEEE
jgi:hypothetical protein